MWNQKTDFTQELAKLKNILGAKYAWLTRGASRDDWNRNRTSKNHDALLSKRRSLTQSERVMHSVQSLHWRRQKDCQIDASTYLAQMAGAQAVRIIGNSEAIKKGRLAQGEHKP
jgi:hypothetical protein